MVDILAVKYKIRAMFGKKRDSQLQTAISDLRAEMKELRQEFESVKMKVEESHSSTYRMHQRVNRWLARDADDSANGKEPELDLNERIRRGLPIDATTSL